MRHSFSPLALFIFLFLVGGLFGVVQYGVITITFFKLGISPNIGILLLVGSLLTSMVNLPVLTIQGRVETPEEQRVPRFMLHRTHTAYEGETLIAVNVGGCVLPVLFCVYLFIVVTPRLVPTLLCTALVTFLSYQFSRPVPGIGIGMPMLLAPLAAAIVAILLAGEERAPVAYIAGTFGVLIGADLLRLRHIPQLATPLASIGGAGTFDGIFMTGLLAVLLT